MFRALADTFECGERTAEKLRVSRTGPSRTLTLNEDDQMKKSLINGLAKGIAVLSVCALSAGVQAGDYKKDAPTDNNYTPPVETPEADVDYNKNCLFFDKVHFTYPVRTRDRGRYKKDFDVIIKSEYGGIEDLTAAVVDELKAECDGAHSWKGHKHCAFNNLDESKIDIKNVSLAVSCKD